MKQHRTQDVEKFDGIMSELERRGITVLRHRPTRWGYVVDAIIPSNKIAILKMPDLTKQVKVAMSQFRDLIKRLESDGYQVIVIPKNSMNEDQVKAFCDRIASGPSLAAA